jgi:hypothetical protein
MYTASIIPDGLISIYPDPDPDQDDDIQYVSGPAPRDPDKSGQSTPALSKVAATPGGDGGTRGAKEPDVRGGGDPMDGGGPVPEAGVETGTDDPMDGKVGDKGAEANGAGVGGGGLEGADANGAGATGGGGEAGDKGAEANGAGAESGTGGDQDVRMGGLEGDKGADANGAGATGGGGEAGDKGAEDTTGEKGAEDGAEGDQDKTMSGIEGDKGAGAEGGTGGGGEAGDKGGDKDTTMDGLEGDKDQDTNVAGDDGGTRRSDRLKAITQSGGPPPAADGVPDKDVPIKKPKKKRANGGKDKDEDKEKEPETEEDEMTDDERVRGLPVSTAEEAAYLASQAIGGGRGHDRVRIFKRMSPFINHRNHFSSTHLTATNSW